MSRSIAHGTAAPAVFAVVIAGVVLPAPAAHAESCIHDSGEFSISVHPPGVASTLRIDLIPVGNSDLSGRATAEKVNVGDQHAIGKATGGIAGNKVDFIVDWPQDYGGGATHFRGEVGADGIAHGTASGSAAHGQYPSSNGAWESLIVPGPWDSTTKLNCGAFTPAAQQATPHDAVTMSIEKRLGSVAVNVTNAASIGGRCSYDATTDNPLIGPTHRDFNVGANASATQTIPGLPTLTTYHVVLSCRGTFNGQNVEFGHVEQDVTY
jgi:hypothetical protein